MYSVLLFDRIIRTNLGKTPMTFQGLEGVLKKIGPPPKVVDKPTSLPEGCKISSEVAADPKYDPPTLKGNDNDCFEYLVF